MEVKQVLHMKAGEGNGSYAQNSVSQRSAIMKAKPILEATIEELCRSGVPEWLRIAELGCSVGPNTLLGVEEIINNIDRTCEKLNLKKPSVEVFLNDLEGNDFNTVFKSLPNFYQKLEKTTHRKYDSCFVAALPGSFYGRLFPTRSIHFAKCSNSLHWLSQVPPGLVSELGEHLNKEKIYIAKSSPPSVQKAYLDQFEKDFSLFLRMRYEEMVPKGHLVLTMMSKNHDDYNTRPMMMGLVLHDMVKEGLIREADLESFNLPTYIPTAEEVKDIIEKEGSFKILHLQTFKQRWIDAYKEDDNKGNRSKGEYRAMFLRAVFEPILASHFGEAMMDELFARCAKAITQYIEIGQVFISNVVVSLVKNAQVGYDVQEA